MARFTALPSDTSEDDEKYVASPPRKPPQPRTRGVIPPSRVQRTDDDVDMNSDSGSSRADEEDEEEEEEDDEDSPSDSSRSRVSARAGGGTYTNEEQEEDEESGGSSRSSLEVMLPEHRRGDPSIIPWAQRIGIDPQKMHVMHASLFPGRESAEAPKLLNTEQTDRTRLTPNGLHRKHSRDSEGEGLRTATREVRLSALFSSSSNVVEFILSSPRCQRASFAHDIEPVAFRPSRKYARVESSASIVNGVEDAMVDAGLAFGRSFRVGWGPSGSLVHLGHLCGPSSTQ